MAWIKQVPVSEVTGLFQKIFDEAICRAGRVWKILHIMSVDPPVLRGHVRA